MVHFEYMYRFRFGQFQNEQQVVEGMCTENNGRIPDAKVNSREATISILPEKSKYKVLLSPSIIIRTLVDKQVRNFSSLQ